MNVAEKDYSATPLWKKLGVKEGMKVLLGAAPYPLLPKLPPPPRGVDLNRHKRERQDVIVYFTTREDSLRRSLPKLAARLNPAGGLWIGWPKRSSTIDSDLTFQIVQQTGLDAGLVDNKSCSIDQDWQALRFVYRLRDRA